MSLNKKIKDYYKKGKKTLFTTPSHGQGEFITESSKEFLGKKFFKSDFSEIDGFDNLRKPEGILKNLQEKISEKYGSKQSYMLTNGSSSGILALMLSILKESEEVLIARNCHISVFNGLVLTGAKPNWFLPEYDNEWGIFKGVTADDVEKALLINNNIKTVIITSPTYEGVFSDIEGISKITKQYGVKLIVDEAHGALLNFGYFKSKPAILCGADASVQSLHKTAGAPNPCALLHLAKDTEIEVQEALNLINTTSPSYPLLSAIESTVDYLSSPKGEKHVKELFGQIEKFKKRLKQNIFVHDGFNDPTKLLIKIGGTSSASVSDVLNNDYNIEEEFSGEKAMLFITGIGTTNKKLEKLAKALNSMKSIESNDNSIFKYKLPDMQITPREARHQSKIKLEKESAIGKISAETIVSYPPGIPIIIAGETITKELISMVEQKEILVCC